MEGMPVQTTKTPACPRTSGTAWNALSGHRRIEVVFRPQVWGWNKHRERGTIHERLPDEQAQARNAKDAPHLAFRVDGYTTPL